MSSSISLNVFGKTFCHFEGLKVIPVYLSTKTPKNWPSDDLFVF